jgi:hypothetical protein
MITNLKKNMKNEHFRKLFLEFSKKESSEEVLEFYEQIILLLSCKENNSDERRRIVKLFLKEGSDKEININNTQKETLTEIFLYDLDSFAILKIEEIIFPVLIDSYIRFSKTKQFYEERIECEQLSINTKKLCRRVKSFNSLVDQQIFKDDWKIKEEYSFKQNWNLGSQKTKSFKSLFSKN